MDGGVIVKALDLVEEFALGDGLGEVLDFAFDVGLGRVRTGDEEGRAVDGTSSAAFNFMRTYVPSAAVSR